jgi:hypothetical protein
MSVRFDVRLDVCLGVCLALALCVSMPGCKKKGESTSPGMDDGGEAQSPHDSTDPLAELALLEGRMQALGLPVATMQSEGENDDMGDAAGTGVTEVGAAGDKLPATEEAPSPAPTAQVDATEPARDVVNYCGDLCSLSESICSLEVRICSLAESHANDSIYADACERAVEDCEVAGQACDGCG